MLANLANLCYGFYMSGEAMYDPALVENERQDLWDRDHVHRVLEDPEKEKYFMVDMFPYPSGTGIHLGHVKNYVATDVQARMRIRDGQNVLHPMGYDSFGLPAENYALANGIHPRVAVEQNIVRFGGQLRRLGLAYDWERQINTTDDEFVKWTQEGFLTLYEKGLVSEEFEPINWCGSCKTGLSNEDLEGDCTCERCGSEVERRLMRQWSVHITNYAEELLEGMDELQEWEPFLLEIQRNWIGKKEGWNLNTVVNGANGATIALDIFVDDPEQIAKAQYVALSPETAKRTEVVKLLTDTESRDKAHAYIEKNLYKRDKDRDQTAGVVLEGLHIVRPTDGAPLPVVLSEVVLEKAHSGALLGDPTDGARDARLAASLGVTYEVDYTPAIEGEALRSQLEAADILSPTKIYRLEDWVFSRQRFWGEPIPIVHCDDCGVVPVPRDQLPVLLPDVEKYELTDNGESPLAGIEAWVDTSCPHCDGPAKRETNTMPQWAGSSWYWHRYKDPHNTEQMVSAEADTYWGQVDMYVGGAEHAARHLIYARFWNRVMQEAGVVRDREPFIKVQHLGLVMDENGVKISKRLGNGVNIDELMDTYGADALRMGMMQAGEFSQQTNWNNREVISAKRFLDRIWRMQDGVDWGNDADPSLIDIKEINAAVQKVTDDVKEFKFNTALATIRKLQSHLQAGDQPISQTSYLSLLSLLQPFAPHITEQIMSLHGKEDYLMRTPWPRPQEIALQADETREIVLMRNGKKIGVFAVDAALMEPNEILAAVRSSSEKVDEMLASEVIRRLVAPEGKGIINLVV